MDEIRLIDANKLKEELKQWFPPYTLEGLEPRVLLRQILHDIDNAPTIIWCSKMPDGTPLMDLRCGKIVPDVKDQWRYEDGSD